MHRYLNLYFAFWRNCFRQALEFRVNFWSNVFTNLGWVLSLVIFMKIIFMNTKAVAGWSEAEMFVLVGTYSTLRGIADTLFYRNLSDLPNQIRTGMMDFILLRPVNSQFYMSLRYVALDNIGQLAGAVLLLWYGISITQQTIPITDLFAYVFLFICGIIIFYSISLITMTLSFWLIRLDNLFVALDTIYSIARTPIDVFKAWGQAPQFFLTYLLPIAFFAAMPVKALFGRPHLIETLIAGPIIAIIFLSISILFWNYATRVYSSASS